MKILYNVTVKVDAEIVEDWLTWMKQVHIPEVMETKCFESYRLTRILGDDDEHGVGFAVQYVSPNIDVFNTYQNDHAKLLQKQHADRYANRYVAFRTLMQIEDESTY
ncbi:MAG: DUF4286 family protein [Saprospiraceae bacterium]|jgi:phenolic acid decarboxylase